MDKIYDWRTVWKKWTTKINTLIAAAAASYPIIREMGGDLSPWVVTTFAVLAAINIYVGNIRQKNLPPT